MEMEKLDIDKELERIIEKYELDRHYPAYRVSRQASNFIRKWVRVKCYNKVVTGVANKV